MGLDTTHGAFNGAYSSFNTFRENLAVHFNLVLDNMIGFGGTSSWSELSDQRLYAFFNHSDCDGSMSVEECKETADAMRDVLASREFEDKEYGSLYHRLETFATGCELAVSKNEPLKFM